MNTVSLSSSMSWGERATTSGIVTLQGMLTIFLVLSLLWVAIEIMHRIIHKAPKTKEEPTEKKQSANANPPIKIMLPSVGITEFDVPRTSVPESVFIRQFPITVYIGLFSSTVIFSSFLQPTNELGSITVTSFPM